MTTPELLDFIKSQIASGASRERITQLLVANGWKLVDINEGFTEVMGAPASALPTTPAPVVSNPLSTQPLEPAASPVSASPALDARPTSIFGQINPIVSPSSAQPVSPIGTYQSSPKEEPLIVVTDALPMQTPAVASPITPPKRKLPWVLLVIVIILAIGVGAAYAYTQYFNEDPQKIVAESFKNLAQATSFTYSGTVNVESSGGPSLDSILPLSMVSAETESQDPAPKDLDLGLNVEAPAASTNLDIRISGAVDVSLGNLEFAVLDTKNTFSVEGKKVGDIVYVKPQIALFPVENTWIMFDPDNQDSNVQLPVVTADQKEKLRAALSSDALFTLKQELPDEAVSDEKVHHYVIELNTKALLANAESEDIAESLALSPVDIWINAKDKTIRKIQFEASSIVNDRNPVAGKAMISLSFDNYNQPVSINAPADAKTLEEVLSSMVQGLVDQTIEGTTADSSDAQKKAAAAGIKAMLMSFRAQAELYSGNHNNTFGAKNTKVGVCSGSGAGGLFTDSYSMKLLADIGKTYTSAGSPRCQVVGSTSSDSAFAIAAALPTGEAYCVDSTGFAGTVLKLSVVDDGNCK